MVLPAKIVELREYKGHTLEAILSGMDVRLDEDKGNVLEYGFPTSFYINLIGIGEVNVTIALFKRSKETERWMRARESISFTVNGQAHAFISKDFFMRSNINLRWIAQDLMIQVDCSNFSPALIERLFMGSRDRRRECAEQKKIEEQLANFLKHHQGLREWNEKRHREILEKKVKESEHTVIILEKLIQENYEVALLLSKGTKVKDPFRHGPSVAIFKGKRFPTFLRLKGNLERPFIKSCPINSYCRVEFETDAENDYLIRSNEPGMLKIKPKSIVKGASLWNGILTLTLEPDEGRELNDEIPVNIKLTTPAALNGYLEENIIFQIIGPHQKHKSPHTPPKPTSKKLAIPEIKEVREEGWHDFGWEKEDIAEIIQENSKLVSYVNMDNPSLKRYLYKESTSKEMLEEQFKVASTIMALALKVAEDNDKINKEDSRKALKEIGRIILPIINTLGKLEK